MTRNLKVLGLALVAALAMSALAASAASATYSFGAPNAPTDGTGSQIGTNIFTTGAGTVECTSATFSGTQGSESSSDVTISPHYTGCTAFTIVGTHVKMNGCTYTFTTPTVDLGGGEFTGESPHVICTGENQIEITPTGFFGSICTVKIPGQTPTSGHVIYKNEGEGTTRVVKVTATVGGIHFTSSGGICGSSGTNGSYEGSVTLRGYQDGNHSIHEPLLIETP
jgi:hypothetical protein